MVKRKTYHFRKNDLIEVEEFHDGNYGAPGKKRRKKEKASPEQIRKMNAINKAKRCRYRLLEYFGEGDLFATWTYEVKQRPSDMAEALKDFQKAIRKVRKEYRKRGQELFWIRNIEKGTKGAWHIHLIINEIGDTASIIKDAWTKGGTYVCEIRFSEKLYDENFEKLSSYMTKDENTLGKKADGTMEKARIAESSYSTSRNMPIPDPKVDKLKRWKDTPKARKGYEIIRIREGINQVTGYRYRSYTMARAKGGPGRKRRREQCPLKHKNFKGGNKDAR